ncbi:MAG: septum formation family protein [Actinomycetota bacterium]
MSRSWPIPALSLVLVVAAAGGCSGGGDYVLDDDIAMRVGLGDCLGSASVDQPETLTIVGCDEAHVAEIYYTFNVPEGDGSWPGESDIEDDAWVVCERAFEPFVGTPYDDSSFLLSYFGPSRDSWETMSDREVLCVLGYFDGDLTKGTARNSFG